MPENMNADVQMINSEVIKANTKWNDSDLDDVIKAANEGANDEAKFMESIDTSDIESEDNGDGFCSEIKDVSLDSSYEDLLAGSAKALAETDASIFDIANGVDISLSDEDVENRMKDNLQMMDMPDADIAEFCMLLSQYRKDKKSIPNVYARMPASMQEVIRKMALSEGIPFTEYNNMAKLFMDEFISQAELDEAFVDVEKSLDEALKMPTIADMYSEHTKEVMEVRIPEIIERIKDTEPENAKLLENIKAAFDDSYSLRRLIDHYKENTRTRKLIRRDWEKPEKFCDEFNFKNQNSKFKMPDCRSIIPALQHVLYVTKDDELDEKEYGFIDKVTSMNITEPDVFKFVILFCRTIMNYDANALLDAAYMYYALRNITMLLMTNETKTPFAAELINNICDVIEFIRKEEEEFHVSNKSNGRKSAKHK